MALNFNSKLTLAGILFALQVAQAAPPSMTGVFPSGLQVGTTKTLKVIGSTGSGTPRIWVSDKRVTIKDAGKGKVTVTAAKNASAGLVWFRLANGEGASELRPIVVGSLAESDEKEPNNHISTAQKVALPRVLNGQLGSGDLDCYRVSLKKGETFVAEVTAHHMLNFQMDGVLQIANEEGIVLGQTDDARGYDPLLVFQAPKTATYLVRVFCFPIKPNSSIAYSGGSQAFYRLTMTQQGYLDHTFPLAVSSSQKSHRVTLYGWNLGKQSQRVSLPGKVERQVVAQAGVGSFVDLPVVDFATVVAAADCSLKKPQSVTMPVSISGRIGRARDEHVFLISCKKGQRVHLAVDARKLGFELDPLVTVLDPQGKQVARLDDSRGSRDVAGTFVAKSAGKYRVQIRDVHEHGGFRFVYRLTIRPDAKDYQLQLPTHMLHVPLGGTASIDVTVARAGGFAGPIKIAAENLPAGITAKTVVSPAKGAAAKKVKLVFAAKGKPASGPILIRGTSGSLKRLATFSVLAERKPNFWVYSAPAKKKK